jgi:hypothetical protein
LGSLIAGAIMGTGRDPRLFMQIAGRTSSRPHLAEVKPGLWIFQNEASLMNIATDLETFFSTEDTGK